jgi:hypothetical protein
MHCLIKFMRTTGIEYKNVTAETMSAAGGHLDLLIGMIEVTAPPTLPHFYLLCC